MGRSYAAPAYHRGVQQWIVGDVRIHAVLQAVIPIPPSRLLSNAPESFPASLIPDYVDASGNILMAIQSFLIESRDSLVLIDTCFPDSFLRERSIPNGFEESLAATGFTAEDISVVVCTHLHRDHAGGNTIERDGKWVPAFAGADYLLTADEHEHWRHSGGEDRAPAESVEPLGTRLRLVDSGHEISDDVALLATPGHTPGHVSVRVESAGAVAYISGDVIHHPVQIGDPGIVTAPDADPAGAITSRRLLLRRVVDERALLLGSHFAAPTGGFVGSRGDGWQWEPSTTGIG